MLPLAANCFVTSAHLHQRKAGGGKRGGNWGAQCQGDFQSCHVLHFLTTRGILAFTLAETRTPRSSSCHNKKNFFYRVCGIMQM